VVEVFLHAPPHVLVHRYRARAATGLRAPVHNDGQRAAELEAHLQECPYRPLGIGRLIRVDAREAADCVADGVICTIRSLRNKGDEHHGAEFARPSMFVGSCLCGSVAFQFERIAGPFELCHCTRCRKSSGSAFAAGLAVETKGFCITRGEELIAGYALPVVDRPPAYKRFFCRQCGGPTPDPTPSGDTLEVPAGCLDGDIDAHPDRHIFVEHAPAWDAGYDTLPRLTKQKLYACRALRARNAGTGTGSNTSMEGSRKRKEVRR
jgi:hypothetical protein